MLEAWLNIEKHLICLVFDGSPECGLAPWSAYSELEGYSGFQGNGLTPLEAIQNFENNVKNRRNYNAAKHGVNNQ